MSAPTFQVTLTSQLTMVETLTGGAVSSGDNTVTLNGYNETVLLTGSSSPAVTKGTAFSQALTSGSATIDLTALPGLTSDETVNLNGLKVQFAKFSNPSGNANKITLTTGASNGYRLDAATSFNFTLAPGQSMLLNLANSSEAVGSSHKTIDLAGTGSQALNVELAAG